MTSEATQIQEQPVAEEQPKPPTKPEPNPTPDPAQQPPDEPFFVAKTQEDLNKKVGNVREEGRTSRDTELLQKSGAESIDDLVAAFTSQQEIAEELKDEAVKEVEGQLKEEQKLSARYKSAIEAQLEARTKDFPDHIKGLLSRIEDPLERYEYLTENEEHFKAPAERVPESPTPSNGSNPEADEKARQEQKRSDAKKF